MSSIWDRLVTLWSVIWQFFSDASSLANAFEIIGGTFALISLIVWRILRWSKKGQQIIIADLREDLQRKAEEKAQLVTTLEEEREHHRALEARLPENVLVRWTQDASSGNLDAGAQMLQAWCRNEGKQIGEILLQRAFWAAARAVGDRRSTGLIVTQGFAIGSLVLDANREDARTLLKDVVDLLEEEGHPGISVSAALREWKRWTDGGTFDVELLQEADAAEIEVEARFDRCLYHLALPLSERVVSLLAQTVGKRSLRSAVAENRRTKILDRLGRYDEALRSARSVTDMLVGFSSSAAALQLAVSQYNEAEVLSHLGRYEEALPIARSVVQACEAHHAFGANSSNTLSCQPLVAEILSALGRHDEALHIAKSATEALKAHPSLGPNHPNTLMSEILESEILVHLGRYEEALQIARSVSDIETALPSLGPSHLHTLESRLIEAKSLDGLGRYEEALSIARSVADAEEAHPSLGPLHPYTLGSRHLVARILFHLGRYEEALPIARAVIEGWKARPASEQIHPDSATSMLNEAEILGLLGRYEEALPIARAAVEALEVHPLIGPEHTHTLVSRFIEAKVMAGVGQYEAALPIARRVSEQMEVHPSLGSMHPYTRASRSLITLCIENTAKELS